MPMGEEESESGKKNRERERRRCGRQWLVCREEKKRKKGPWVGKEILKIQFSKSFQKDV